MKRLGQTRVVHPLAQALRTVATLQAQIRALNAEVAELKTEVRHLLQVDPVLEARLEKLEAVAPRDA